MKIRTTLFAILLCLLSTSGVVGQKKYYFDVADSISFWVQTRVDRAAAGNPEKIQMPLAVRSLGWGCRCPDYYIGVNSNVQEGPFIQIVGAMSFPTPDQNGTALIVTGYFTGKWVEIDLRDEGGEPEEWLYRVPEFKVESWKINENPEETEAPKILGKQRKVKN